MKTVTVLVFLICHCFLSGGFAQDCSIDSLQNLLNQSSNDTIKVNLLNQAAWCCRLQSKFQQGISHANEAKILAKHLHLSSEEARAYFILGCIYFEISDYQESLNNHQASISIREALADSVNLPVSFNNLANTYANLGDNIKALNFQFKALELFERTRNYKGAAGSYTNMGLMYAGDGNYTQALKYHHKSLEMMQQIHDKQGEAIAELNIGGVHFSLLNYKEALKHHTRSLELMTEVKNKRGIANCLKNIGSCHEKEGNYQEAMDYLNRSVALSEEINDRKGAVVTKLLIGDLKILCGLPEEAAPYYQDALKLARRIGNKTTLKNCYRSISRLDSIRGDCSGALLNYKLFTLYKDSLVNEESQKQANRLKAQFETERKEREIQLLKSQGEIKALELQQRVTELNFEKLSSRQKSHQIQLLSHEKQNQLLTLAMKSGEVEMQRAEIESRKRENELLLNEKNLQKAIVSRQHILRNSILAVSILIIVIGLLLFNRYRIGQMQRQEAERARIGSDLHDEVGSTLSSINMFSLFALKEMELDNISNARNILKEIATTSSEMVDEMSDIVWTVNPRNDSLESVINRLRNFAVNVAQSQNFELNFQVPENLNELPLKVETRKNLFLICKEAVNNAAKYSHCKHLMIRFAWKQNDLYASIQDDGTGFSYDGHKSAQEPEGNGLKNMKQRAEAMKALLTIHSVPGKGTTIELRLSV